MPTCNPLNKMFCNGSFWEAQAVFYLSWITFGSLFDPTMSIIITRWIMIFWTLLLFTHKTFLLWFSCNVFELLFSNLLQHKHQNVICILNDAFVCFQQWKWSLKSAKTSLHTASIQLSSSFHATFTSNYAFTFIINLPDVKILAY